jgi:hypothetical protein
LSTLFVLLKYTGLLIATISSLWGTLHDLTTHSPEGQRVLTKSGRLAVWLTVIGLLVTAGSTYLDDRIKQQAAFDEALRSQRKQAEEAQRQEQEAIDRFTDRQERRDTEQKRERDEALRAQQLSDQAHMLEQHEITRQLRQTRDIIVSGEQLESLSLTWTFEDVPRYYLDKMRAVTSGFHEPETKLTEYERAFGFPPPSAMKSPHNFIERHLLLYPWLNVLAGGNWSDVGCLALLSLDDSLSSVLPLGRVPFNQAPSAAMKSEPATVEFTDEFSEAMALKKGPIRDYYPYFLANARISGSGLEISWEIPPYNLQSAIYHVSGSGETKAGLPENIKLVLLSSEKGLTQGAQNFSKKISIFLGQPLADPGEHFLRKSILVVRPNSLVQYEVKYRMRFAGRSRAEAGQCPDCLIASWIGTRAEAP